MSAKLPSSSYTLAVSGHEYCFCKRALGWMNSGMVHVDERAWWAARHLRTPDRQYGPATAVVFVPFCDRRGNFLPEEIIRLHATLTFKATP
jgi:hypothetical protein